MVKIKQYSLRQVDEGLKIGTAFYNRITRTFEITLDGKNEVEYLAILARIIDAATKKGSFRILQVGDSLFFSNVSLFAWQTIRQMLFLHAYIIVDEAS